MKRNPLSNALEYANEAALEDDLVRRPHELLQNPPTWIARQLHTSANGFIDLLGMESDGRLVVYELKVKRTGRQTMAQILDYASWIDTESLDEIARRVAQASVEPRSSRDHSLSHYTEDQLRPARLVIVAGEANAALSRMVQYIQKLGLDIRIETIRHVVSASPELYDIAQRFGVGRQWAASLETLDHCFDGRGHRLRRLPNGLNYELRDQSGSLRSFAGVFVNNRKVGRELGEIFVAIHDVTIEQSEAEFERLKLALEAIGLTPQRGNVRMKFYARSRADLTPALREIRDFLTRTLDEEWPRESLDE